MSKINLTKDFIEVLTGKDGIIIRKHLAGIEGGRALDLTDYTAEVIPAGLPIITKTTGDTTTYRPLPPADADSTYTFTLPEGFSYAGIAAATIRTNQMCPIMIAGVVGEKALIDSLTSLFPSALENPNTLALSAIKTALPNIIFINDEA